jgi:hypothetical protein
MTTITSPVAHEKTIRVKTGNRKKSGTVYMENGDKIDFYQPEIRGHHVEMNFVQQYHNAIHVLFGLNGCAKDILNYLLIEMDRDNVVTFVIHHKKAFLEIASQSTVEGNKKTMYGLRTVNNAIWLLKKKQIIREISRGTYLVNPTYYFKDDVSRDGGKKRFEMIRLELEFQAGNKRPEIKTKVA